MDITVSHEQGRAPVTILHVQGDIDASTSERLESEARAAIDGGARSVVVDLAGVRYMGSAGVRALHRIFALLRKTYKTESDAAMLQGLRDGTFRSPHLKLLRPNKHVRDVLNLTGMDMYLEIFDDLRSAVESF